ncbi:MAG: hypothetical protein IIU58_00595 [Clostridia bacterium]|nr:hypothetical protein [Clostridia bacterium]
MKKLTKMNEAAWVLGVLLCALGVALCTKANLGLSMIAAPPYIIHIFMQNYFPWYSQGTSEYIWQAFLLMLVCIVIRRFKPKYLLSFVSAMLFGFAIDGWLLLLGGKAAFITVPIRVLALIIGENITAFAIACYFRTDMPLQIYELVVAEIARAFRLDLNKAKQINDIGMLLLSVVLALTLNRSFQGMGIGTIIITVANAPLIALYGKLLDKYCDFSPRFPRFIAWLKK